MGLREIPAAEWQQFLDEFNRGHRAWLATIEPAGTLHGRSALERPLKSVTPIRHASGAVTIEIRFLDSQGRSDVHIEQPARLRVDETAEGTAQGLEFVDAAGERTRIRFRAAPKAEILDGIAPGELSST